MLKKQLIGNFYLFVVLISFLSCKHEELIKNDQRSSTNFNPPIPIIAPTLYYTEQLSPSRQIIYSLSNLGAAIPKVKQLSTNAPWGNSKRAYCFNPNTEEIWYFNELISTDYLYKYSVNNLKEQSAEFGGDKSLSNRDFLKLDLKNNKMYYLINTNPPPNQYSSRFYNQIRKSNFDGTNEEVVFTLPDNERIYAMDVDLEKGKIYYTNQTQNKIYVVNTNGNDNKIIVNNAGFVAVNYNGFGHYNLAQIKVDPTKGKIYWIKYDLNKKQAAIMSATTTGENVTTLWQTGFQAEYYKLNFDLDIPNQKIFFCFSGMVTNTGDASYLIRIDMDRKNIKAMHHPIGSIKNLVVAYPKANLLN